MRLLGYVPSGSSTVGLQRLPLTCDSTYSSVSTELACCTHANQVSRSCCASDSRIHVHVWIFKKEYKSALIMTPFPFQFCF